jgi:putative membrane protein
MIERANRLHAALSPFDRSVVLLIIAWVLAMISLPILRWGLGESALPIGISVGVLLQLMLVLAILLWTWGGRRTALVVAVIVVCAWLVEYIGHTTGFPFGGYAYTERLQPQVGGVPLLIPLAWLMMLPPSWAVAGRRAGRAAQGRLAFVIVSALAFTAWDLFLDPQMVGWNLWVWTPPGGYFGIPWANFAGWLVAAALITALASVLAPLRELPARPLIAIYAISWALEVIGLLCFWGLPGPALAGGMGMGAALVRAWHRKG